jgi:Lar family restriction alleviation protein
MNMSTTNTMKNHSFDSVLRPCPFCGGKAKLLYIYVHQVVCEDCHAATTFYQDENDAVAAWNGRKDEVQKA